MKLIRAEKDPYLRAEAVGVIRQTGSDHPRLAELALARTGDADLNVRAQAAGLLGNLRKSKAIPRLIALFRDPHWSVQESAENALHNFGAQALPQLVKALADRSASVRYRAARLIGEVGRPNAIAPLEKVTRRKGENQDVIRAAREAVEKIRERRPKGV
jgi:HEAT repeat protein